MSQEVDYSGSPELQQSLPRLLAEAGIETKRLRAGESSAGRRFELLCTRGSSHIHMAGYEVAGAWTFTLDYGNPFRYLFCKGDRVLLKELEALLLQNGAVCNDGTQPAAT